MTVVQSVHFVLVHGSSHGAWCWYKLRCLLESAGQKVSCMDLLGSGIDHTDPNTIFTFQEYNKPLDDLLSSLSKGEKVILVGHSAGGLSVTDAIHKYPDSILAAVFVGASMIKNGHDDTLPPTDLAKYCDCEYGLGPDQPPTSVIFKKEFQRLILYQLSPLEDYTLAAMLLRPCPSRAIAAAIFPDGGQDIEKVPRVYIKTLHDNVVSQELQDAMIQKWPPNDVYTIDSDHCAFFSKPVELFNLLFTEVRAKFACR